MKDPSANKAHQLHGSRVGIIIRDLTTGGLDGGGVSRGRLAADDIHTATGTTGPGTP